MAIFSGIPDLSKTEKELSELNQSLKEFNKNFKKFDENTTKLTKGMIGLTFILLFIGIMQLIFSISPVEGSKWTKTTWALIVIFTMVLVARKVFKDLFGSKK